MLKYEQQMDGHRCGYYVLFSMRLARKVSSTLPMVSLEKYNNNHTFKLRDICNVILIGSILDTYIEKYGDSSTVDLFRFLTARINGNWYEDEECRFMRKNFKKSVGNLSEGDVQCMLPAQEQGRRTDCDVTVPSPHYTYKKRE